MNVINIHQAKTHFSKLVERVQRGEEIVIGKAGKPVAKLVPFEEPEKKAGKRQFGIWKGKVWMSDDFDEADEETTRLFEGEDDWDFSSTPM